MAKYTTEIRTIVASGKNIFSDYPIFDEKYRPILEQKIIDHYYFREIGFETYAQFKHFLKDKMNRIMPYYNQLYGSEHLITKDDYMINLNTKEKHTRTISNDNTGESKTVSSGSNKSTSEGSGTNHSEGTGRNKFSDTPQAMLDGKDYATNLTDTEDESNQTSTSQGSATSTDSAIGEFTNSGQSKTTEEYITEMSGGGGMRYNADILMEWRKSFLNIDQQIIDELTDLFMNIY